MIDRVYFYDALNRKAKLFGGHISTGQKESIDAIFDYWDLSTGFEDMRWLAYMLGTVYHETGRTMMPIREWGRGAGKPYSKRVKYGGLIHYTDTEEIFYGRGLIQLTWYDNYVKAGKLCHCDMIQNADLALDLDNAIKIMFAGMKEGWITGAKLKTFFPPDARYFGTGMQKATPAADNSFLAAADPLWCPVPNPKSFFSTPYLLAPPSLMLHPDGDWFNARRIINGQDCAELIKGYALDFFRCLTAKPAPQKSYWLGAAAMSYAK